MKRLICLLFVSGLLLSCTGRSSVLAASSLPGLSVSGTQIVANGVPVRLRGVNMGDPFWARNSDRYPIPTIDNYATLGAEWHANIVRISIFPRSGSTWTTRNCSPALPGKSMPPSRTACT